MSGFMDLELRTALRQYVSPTMPFGPVDSTNISEPACAVRLYEWQNNAFGELLRGSHVIIGRRGSGKSALIKMIRDARLLSSRFRSERSKAYRDVFGFSLKARNEPDLVLEIDLPQQMFEMELQFSQLKVIPSVEIVGQHWINRIYFLIGDQIRQEDTQLWESLPASARRYITAQDLVQVDPTDRQAVLSVSGFAETIRDTLARHEKKVILTFDSLEEYKFDNTQNVIMAGLFRAVGQLIARQESPVDVKLCLPAEMYSFIRPNIINPDKDTTRKQFLHWNAEELMRVAAHRLKVFFEVHDLEEYDQVREIQLRDRDQLRIFWSRYLPPGITNRLGVREDTFRYILRHTQLLPRQVIMIMNSAFRNAYGGECRRQVSEADIVGGVQENESTFSDTITKMFAVQYPHAALIMRKVLPRLSRVFPYGVFEKVWREEAKDLMSAMSKPEYWEFIRMMMSTGAVGLVDSNMRTEIYVGGLFEFNTEHEIMVSDKDTLCIHPIFSGIFNTTPPSERRVVLPRGSDYGPHLPSD